jgi:hypothetical protein
MKHRQIRTSYSRILHIEDNICFVTIGNCTYFPNVLLIPANLLFTTIVASLIGHQQVVTLQIWNIRTIGGTLPQNQIKFCVLECLKDIFVNQSYLSWVLLLTKILQSFIFSCLIPFGEQCSVSQFTDAATSATASGKSSHCDKCCASATLSPSFPWYKLPHTHPSQLLLQTRSSENSWLDLNLWMEAAWGICSQILNAWNPLNTFDETSTCLLWPNLWHI